MRSLPALAASLVFSSPAFAACGGSFSGFVADLRGKVDAILGARSRLAVQAEQLRLGLPADAGFVVTALARISPEPETGRRVR